MSAQPPAESEPQTPVHVADSPGWLAALGEGLWLLDGEGITRHASARILEWLDCGESEIAGRALWEFVPPEGRSAARTMLAFHYAGQVDRSVLHLQGQHGSDVWVRLSSYPASTGPGEAGLLLILSPLAIQGVTTPVAPWFAVAQPSVPDLVAERAPVALLTCEGEGLEIRWANTATQRLVRSSFRDRDIQGLPAPQVLDLRGGQAIADALRRVARTAEPSEWQELEGPSEEDGPTQWNVAVLPLPGGAQDVLLTAVDVTAAVRERQGQQTKQAQLSAQLRQFQLALSSVEEGVMVADAEGRWISLNPAALRLYGHSVAGECQAPPADLVAEWELYSLAGKPVPATETPLARILNGSVLSGLDLLLRHGPTGRSWVGCFGGAPVWNDDGSLALTIVTVRDVTDRRVAEQDQGRLAVRLEAAEQTAVLSQRRWNSIVDGLPHIVWSAGSEGVPDFFNDRWYEHTGLRRELTMGSPDLWRRVLHPEDLPHFERHWAITLESGQPLEMEVRLLHHADGAWRWHLARASSVADGEDARRWWGTFTDIDDRTRSEAERRSAHQRDREQRDSLEARVQQAEETGERFRRVFASNLTPVAFWNLLGNITDANDAFLSLLGVSRDEFREHRLRWDDVTPPEYVAIDELALAEVLQTGVAVPYEKELIHTGGQRVPVLLGLALLDGREGVAFAVDISDRQRAERELRRRTTELVRLNEELQQFAHVASHDLQEPLRNIASFLQLLSRRYSGKLDEEADQYIQFAVEGANRMSSLIHGLLAYSRSNVEARRFEPVALADVLEFACQNLSTLLSESGAEVTHDDLPVVPGDASQLTQVLQNLVANAVRYRGADAPRVHIGAAPEGDLWHLRVRDNGIGFESHNAEQIFGLFTRLHGREYPGTGLGLAICRKIVERHGGRIWAESEPGIGSTFHLTLPALSPIAPLAS